MIKTYKITKPCHNYSTIIRGKGGNAQRFDFTGGNEMSGTPARLILRSQYSQTLLESSDLFKSGYVKLERVGEGGEQPVIIKQQETTVIEDIVSPEQLLEFCATKLEKVYQRPEAALEYAKKKGFEFPNLEKKKED